MIHLEKIDSTNIWETVDLKVFKSQKNFVAANWVSIVQAYSVRDSATAAFPFAIYNDKRPVGFLMIGFNEAALYENWDDVEAPKSLVNNYSLWRLMIDKRYQKRGYGREERGPAEKPNIAPFLTSRRTRWQESYTIP